MAQQRVSLFNGVMIGRKYGVIFRATQKVTLETIIVTNDGFDGRLLSIDLTEDEPKITGGVAPIDRSTSIFANFPITSNKTVLLYQLTGLVMLPKWVLLAKSGNTDDSNKSLSMRGSGILS